MGKKSLTAKPSSVDLFNTKQINEAVSGDHLCMITQQFVNVERALLHINYTRSILL